MVVAPVLTFDRATKRQTLAWRLRADMDPRVVLFAVIGKPVARATTRVSTGARSNTPLGLERYCVAFSRARTVRWSNPEGQFEVPHRKMFAKGQLAPPKMQVGPKSASAN